MLSRASGALALMPAVTMILASCGGEERGGVDQEGDVTEEEAVETWGEEETVPIPEIGYGI